MENLINYNLDPSSSDQSDQSDLRVINLLMINLKIETVFNP